MNKLTISSPYDIGDVVFLLTDRDRYDRIVTAIIIRHKNVIMYELSCEEDISVHHDFEITTDRNYGFSRN